MKIKANPKNIKMSHSFVHLPLASYWINLESNPFC